MRGATGHKSQTSRIKCPDRHTRTKKSSSRLHSSCSSEMSKFIKLSTFHVLCTTESWSSVEIWSKLALTVLLTDPPPDAAQQCNKGACQANPAQHAAKRRACSCDRTNKRANCAKRLGHRCQHEVRRHEDRHLCCSSA